MRPWIERKLAANAWGSLVTFIRRLFAMLPSMTLAATLTQGCNPTPAPDAPVATTWADVVTTPPTSPPDAKPAPGAPKTAVLVASPPGTAATPPRAERPATRASQQPYVPVYKLPEPEQGLKYLESYLSESPERLRRLASLRKSNADQEVVRFTVDSSVERLWVVVEGSALTSRLLDGAGGEVAVAESVAGRNVYSVKQAKPGAWRLELDAGSPPGAPHTAVAVNVYAKSDRSLRASADRTTRTPNGVLPLLGRPQVDEKIRFRCEPWVRLSKQSEFKRLRFGVIRAEGKPRWVQTALVANARGSLMAWETGEMSLRSDERVIVEANLRNGERIQHDAPALTPSHFLISPELSGSLRRRVAESAVTPTSWARILVDVSRRGSGGKVVMGVKLSPRDVDDVEARIDPLTFELQDGETQRVSLFFRATQQGVARKPEGKGYSPLLTVGASADDPLGNEVPVELTLEQDTDGDGIADSTEQQRGPDNDADGDAIPDFKQREVITFGRGEVALRLSPAVTLSTIERIRPKASELPNKIAPNYDAWRIRLADDTITLPTQMKLFHVFGRRGPANALYVQTTAGGPWLKRGEYDPESGVFTLYLSSEEAGALRSGGFAIAAVQLPSKSQ